jgi:RNA polymerase subunit RPABC4/transcription elongation factor Spt4
MKKDRQNCCPKCGSTKISKQYARRVYFCENGHKFFTGDVIPLFSFKKKVCRNHFHTCKDRHYIDYEKCPDCGEEKLQPYQRKMLEFSPRSLLKV